MKMKKYILGVGTVIISVAKVSINNANPYVGAIILGKYKKYIIFHSKIEVKLLKQMVS
jgi:hypothetical protein